MSSLVGAVKGVFETLGYRAFQWFSATFPAVASKIKPNTGAYFITAFVLAWALTESAVYFFLYTNPLLFLDAVVCSILAAVVIYLFKKTGFYGIKTWDEYRYVVFGERAVAIAGSEREWERDWETASDEEEDEDEDYEDDEDEDYEEELDEESPEESEEAADKTPVEAPKELDTPRADFRFPVQEEAVVKGENPLTENYQVLTLEERKIDS
jgi:hypothetical protein